MAVITPPSLTPAPTPAPQRNDRTTFSSRVDAFVTWLITAVTEFGAVANNVALNATDAATSASTASTQAGNAVTSASTASTQASNAATSASTATTQASTATTQAGLATTNGAAQVALATTQANNAATSAATAATQAGIATTKAGEASASASAAAASVASISGGPVTSVNSKTGVVTLVKADIGLGSVDNTSDSGKPVSTATQAALNAKQATLVSGTNLKTVNGLSLVGSGDVLIVPASFVSANQTIVNSSKLTIAHGLGSSALRLGLYLVCVSVDVGYSVGDVVLVDMAQTLNIGAVISADSSNIYIVVANGGFRILNKSTFTTELLTNTSWKLIAKAWK